MSKTTIHIAFDGPDVENGTMDARALAPALLGISNLLEDANRTLNGVVVPFQLKTGSQVHL